MSPTPAADTLRRIARVVLLALALALAPVPGSPTSPVAHAADNGTWSVYPTPSKATDPASRTYFTLTSPPGATLKDHVTISNQSDHPITFKVYGADAYNTPRDGGFALRGTDEPQTDIGAWIKLDTTTVTVPAKKRTAIPFTLSIPANATPGDHSGAVVALDPTVEGTQNHGAVTVGIKRAVGARLYLRVNGPTHPDLAIENVRLDHDAPTLPWTRPSQATLHYTLVNRGNTRLQPRLDLTATNLLGHTTLHTQPRDLALTLLPGQRVELTEPWPNAPQLGRYTLTLRATTPDNGPQTTARTTLTAIPWAALTLLLTLITAATTLPRVRRHLRTRRAQAQTQDG